MWNISPKSEYFCIFRIWIFSVIQGYGLAWISHFWIEENKPATFKYPVYSFISDFVMFKDACLGNVSLF